MSSSKSESFNFIFLLLVKHKSKHFAIFLISIFIVFLTSSILFIKNSLQKEISDALENQSDFIIQKTVANKIKDIDKIDLAQYAEKYDDDYVYETKKKNISNK